MTRQRRRVLRGRDNSASALKQHEQHEVAVSIKSKFLARHVRFGYLNSTCP